MRPQLNDQHRSPADVVLEHHITMVCLRLRTRAAREWMRQHVPRPDYAESPWELYCSVELGHAILQGMASSGLEVEAPTAARNAA